MKLITEVVEECNVATELNEATGKKSYFIEGIFMQGDIKNRNGRIYPSAVLEKEMKRYQKDFIDTKRALGEVGHPDGPTINGDRISHLITEMSRDGSNFVGKAKILSTPMGEIVKEVQDDFYLATVDIVTDPSGPNCFVNGIMENTEYFYDIAKGNWVAKESIEEVIEEMQQQVEKEIRRTVRRIDEATAAQMFERFVKSLRS